MYKTETHAHTFPVSTCSKISAKEMVRLYKNAGYDTLFITDHFSPYHFEKMGKGLTFSECVDNLYNAFLEAKEEGDRLGIKVVFAVEYSLHGNHYLLYGVTKEFLKLREDIFDISIEEFHEYAKSNGITVVQAHPYMEGKCTPYPQFVDGFEGINASTISEMHNDRSLKTAKKFGLPISCGSDAHELEDIGRTAMLSEEKITSAKQYIELMFDGKLILWVNGETICNSLGNCI